MTTITKPMTIERAFESAKRFVEDAAKPHKIFMLAAEAPPLHGYIIPISGGAAALSEPDDDVEVIAGTIQENGEPVSLDPPTEVKRRRRRLPRPVENVYYHNPYREEPLTVELCAVHLNVSRTSFYKLVNEFPELAKRAIKTNGRAMRFTRHSLDKWRRSLKGTLPVPVGGAMPTPSGRNLAPAERKGVVQPRCTVINKDGSQCRGLTMKGGYTVCAIHAMNGTSARAEHDEERPAT